jgi:hypothetical protein
VHLRSVTFRPGGMASVYGGVAALMAITGALVLPAEGLDISSGHFWWIAAGSIAVAGALIACNGLWSAAGAYAAVFWCFHFGLIGVLAGGLVAPMELSLWDQLWVLGPYGTDAAFLALIGMTAFAAGASLVRGWGTPVIAPKPGGRPHAVHPYGPAGSVAVVVSAALWAALVTWTSGPAGFFGSYGDYLNAIEPYGAVVGVVWLTAGCGLVMSVTGAPGRLRTIALATFGGWAIVALPLGLRGEIMFPTVAALVAAARCGRALSPRRAGAFVALLLVLIPAMREIRQTGLQGLPDMVIDLRFFDAFVELGGSLHPVEKVVRWRAEGEALAMGASYWAPFERAAARLLPGVQAAAAEDDMRIMNVLVIDRIGAIGFSPVAEAYRNFGALGVVCVLGLLGAALAAIDRIADPRMAILAIATLYVPLLVNVRNSFISVPMQCALGLLFLAGIGVMRHVSSSIVCRPYARAPYVRSQV